MLSKKELKLISSTCSKFAFSDGLIEDSIKPFVQSLLSKENSPGSTRELVTLERFGFENSEGKFDEDGICPKGHKLSPDRDRNAEIKTESPSATDGKFKCTGTFGVKTKETMKKFIGSDPIVGLAGYTDNGKCAYALSFDLKESDLPEKLMKSCDTGVAVKSGLRTVKDLESLVVDYYNPKYEDLFTAPFKTLLETAMQNEKKKELTKKSVKELDVLFTTLSKDDKIRLLSNTA